VRDRLRTLLVLAALYVLRRRLPRRAGTAAHAQPEGPRERIVPAGTPQPRAELLAIGLLLFGAVCAVAFVAVYVLDRVPRQTQLLGLSLGLALLSIAAALIVTGKRLVVTEELEHDYPPEEHADEQEAIAQTVAESASRLTRRRLFALGLGTAGGALAAAMLAPLASLGPGIDLDSFVRTPWRRGRRLVDEDGKPYRAADIDQDTFYTAFPEGADREQLASPLVVVRLPPRDFDLPRENAGFPAAGIVAFSKICTHAGCAIALYRTPLFPDAEPKPALVCPCHYSTFDPATGGTVIFGPAGRKLPMLPLRIDGRGYLRAAGNFDAPVGPSWWEVRARRPIA
jgi:ubiquinol-cytochrome c reductase iron-sulfur subunit